MQRDRPRDPIVGVGLRYLQPVELAVLLEELSLRFYAFALSLLVGTHPQIQRHLPDGALWAVAVGSRHRYPSLPLKGAGHGVVPRMLFDKTKGAIYPKGASGKQELFGWGPTSDFTRLTNFSGCPPRRTRLPIFEARHPGSEDPARR